MPLEKVQKVPAVQFELESPDTSLKQLPTQLNLNLKKHQPKQDQPVEDLELKKQQTKLPELQNKQNKNLTNTINKKKTSSSKLNISMLVLGGFIAVCGIAAIALAFTLVNPTTLGIVGGLLILGGIGLFAAGYNRNKNTNNTQIQVKDLESQILPIF